MRVEVELSSLVDEETAFGYIANNSLVWVVDNVGFTMGEKVLPDLLDANGVLKKGFMKEKE